MTATRTPKLDEPQANIDRLTAEVAAGHGKKGNAARRLELEALQAHYSGLRNRLRAIRRQAHAASNANCFDDGTPKFRTPRTGSYISRVRANIERYAAATVVRGEYGELLIRSGVNRYGHAGDEARPAIDRYRTHPQLRHLAAFQHAWRMIDSAAANGKIPDRMSDFDDRQCGTAINHDLYGFTPDLALVQVRTWRRTSTKYPGAITKQYLITDGATAVEITNGKKSLIKKAATIDATPDSTLRMIKDVLPPAWQELVTGSAPKLLATAGQHRTMTTYKIVRQNGEGEMVSLHDGWTRYVINQRLTNRLGEDAGKYRYDYGQIHEGGYYSHPAIGRTLELQDAGRLANNDRNPDLTYVLLECEISGRIVQFDNGKLASTYIKPLRILATYGIEQMPTVEAVIIRNAL